jgi:hypothetical protein
MMTEQNDPQTPREMEPRQRLIVIVHNALESATSTREAAESVISQVGDDAEVLAILTSIGAKKIITQERCAIRRDCIVQDEIKHERVLPPPMNRTTRGGDALKIFGGHQVRSYLRDYAVGYHRLGDCTRAQLISTSERLRRSGAGMLRNGGPATTASTCSVSHALSERPAISTASKTPANSGSGWGWHRHTRRSSQSIDAALCGRLATRSSDIARGAVTRMATSTTHVAPMKIVSTRISPTDTVTVAQSGTWRRGSCETSGKNGRASPATDGRRTDHEEADHVCGLGGGDRELPAVYSA